MSTVVDLYVEDRPITRMDKDFRVCNLLYKNALKEKDRPLKIENIKKDATPFCCLIG